MSKCAFQFTEDGDRTAVYWSAGIAAAMRSVYNLIHSIRQWEWIGQTDKTITPGITSPTLLQHCIGSQLNVPLLSHTSIKPGRLLSGLTLFSGHLSESQKLCQSFHVKKTSIKRPLLLSGSGHRAFSTIDFVLKGQEENFARIWESQFKSLHVIICKCTASVSFVFVKIVYRLHTRYRLYMNFLPRLMLPFGEHLLRGQPLLSGHLLIPRGWPLKSSGLVI